MTPIKVAMQYDSAVMLRPVRASCADYNGSIDRVSIQSRQRCEAIGDCTPRPAM